MNSDNKACCAHLTVLYVTEPAGDDAVKGKWTCRECGHEFVPQARLDAAREERRAPIQGYAAGIPWSLHLRAWDVYAAKWGSGQTAERLAERGGFAVDEMDEFVPGWRDEVSELATTQEARDEYADQAVDAIRLLRKTRKARDRAWDIVERKNGLIVERHKELDLAEAINVNNRMTYEVTGRALEKVKAERNAAQEELKDITPRLHYLRDANADLVKCAEKRKQERDKALKALDVQRTVTVGAIVALSPEEEKSNRDKQVETATRLQLINVVKDWRESGKSVDQLLFRLQTTHIRIPDTMVKARQ